MTIVDQYYEWHHCVQAKYGPMSIALVQVGTFAESYSFLTKEGEYDLPGFRKYITTAGLVAGNKAVAGPRECKVAGFGVSQLDKYVDKLVDAGWTVAYYKQDIAAANSTRSLDRVFSPS